MSAIDIALIGFLVFVFGILSLFGYTFFTNFHDRVSDAGLNSTTYTAEYVKAENNWWDTMDNVVLFLFFGSVLATILTSFLIDTHPAFFVASLLVLFITILLAVVFSNIYTEAGTSLSDAADRMPGMKTVMDYLVPVLAATGLIIFIVTFAKTRGGNK